MKFALLLLFMFCCQISMAADFEGEFRVNKQDCFYRAQPVECDFPATSLRVYWDQVYGTLDVHWMAGDQEVWTDTFLNSSEEFDGDRIVDSIKVNADGLGFAAEHKVIHPDATKLTTIFLFRKQECNRFTYTSSTVPLDARVHNAQFELEKISP